MTSHHRQLSVLHVISKSEHGGAQSQVELLATGLVDLGHDVTVISSTPGPLLDAVEAHGASTGVVDGLSSSDPLRIVRSIRALRATIRDSRPDVVHCHSSHAGLTTRIAAASTRTPCVFTAHGLPFKQGVPAVRRLVAWLAELALARLPATIICVSDHERSLARRALRMPQRRLRMIPTAVADRVEHDEQPEPTETSSLQMSSLRTMRIGTVCRLAPPKRVDVLIGAIARLERPASLTVVGTGPQAADLSALGERLAVSVDFLGDRADVADVLATFDIFVICSDHEGAPVSVLEAMRAGLPVVASDLPGIRGQLGASGVFAQNEPAAFAQQLDALLASDQLRREQGAANRQRFVERFTATSLLAATIAVYEDVASRSSMR